MKKIYMILAAMTLLSLSLNAQTKSIITVASSDFSDASYWTTYDENNDGSTWAVTSNYGRYTYNGSNAADDWLVSSAIALQAGKTYTFSLDAWEQSTTYPEKLEVKLLTANNQAALSSGTTIITETTVTSTSQYSPNNLSNTFTVPTSGDYYIGIHATSARNMYYLFVDNMSITLDSTDPLIMASPLSVSMSATPNGTATQTVTVTGDNLTEGITATISGDNVLSVSPTSLGTTGGTLTITYSPTAPGDHSATITLTSAGADPVTINVTGSCVPGTIYELVTDPSTQLVADKKYIIVHDNYAMGALSGTSGYGARVDITNNGDGTVTVPGTASPMVLTLHDYTNTYNSNYKYTFTLTNGGYLMTESSGSNLTTTSSAINNASWRYVADVKNTGGYGIQCYRTTSRAIAYQTGGTRFANYATSNLTASAEDYFYGLLYVEVDDTPVLTAPVDGSTVHVGDLEEGGATSVSKTIPVTGRNLTGTGFSVSPATLTAAAVNAGTTVTVTYTYTRDVNATGELTIGSSEASTTVDLTATYISHDPTLTAPTDGSTIDVGTNSGDGASTTVTVSGQYLTEDLTVSVTGTGFSVEPTTISAEDVNNGTATITVIYVGNDPNNPNGEGTLTISSSEIGTVTVDLTANFAIVTGGHMIHLAIPVVDQLAASTATNSHPRGYGYVLKYEPTYGEKKESGRVEVPVQHTGSTVNGYYTKAEVDGDTDIMSADVDMTLSATNTNVFYNTIQGKANALPAEYANYYTVLQRQTDGTFVELKTGSYLTGKVYQPGEYHYYDSIPTTGTYGSSFKTYVPVVMTMGHDRRYYEEDSLHNTYGAPIWKTGVGQVRMISTEAQQQVGPNGSTTWEGVGGDCSLYFLGLEAYGDLPSADVSNIVYEPYMFRVWIQSPGNKLRGCTYVAAGVDPNKPGAHWTGDGTSYGSDPVLVYEGQTTDGHIVLDIESMQEGNNAPWGEEISFGALNGIDDLDVIVRFYYKSTGVAQNASTNTLTLYNRDEARDYYATEGDDSPEVTTGIHGVYTDLNKPVESVTYVNAQGMTSDKPFDGLNIVITRYTDGSTRTTKVVK